MYFLFYKAYWYVYAHSNVQTHTHTHTHTHMHAHARTRTDGRTDGRTHGRTHSLTQARAHTHTHTHTRKGIHVSKHDIKICTVWSGCAHTIASTTPLICLCMPGLHAWVYAHTMPAFLFLICAITIAFFFCMHPFRLLQHADVLQWAVNQKTKMPTMRVDA